VETWDAIRARRNVRAYRPDPVAASDLDRITEAGRRAPSASNRQHWDFIVVTEPHQLRALPRPSPWSCRGPKTTVPASWTTTTSGRPPTP
jgi:nitroreductase